jgi:hypothetical protein
MRANFTECALRYQNDDTLKEWWGWNGSLIGLSHNKTTQISREGCLAVCGPGSDFYLWKDTSSTITTWVLPVVGILLQAPFESHAFRRTLLAITRWVGSPIASLSYILWNIKVSAKAALMVDMSVKYSDTPKRKTDFDSMRDSLYLLLVMNQYTMKRTSALQKEAEGLLRIVLFSRDLNLTDTNVPLRKMRRILAAEVREMRRRGAVPGQPSVLPFVDHAADQHQAFISILWFLFAFALSIQSAFGDLGENTTAHDLALGCLLAWFPILIMGSIVDRNPIAADVIRKKLNSLVDHVRHALRDEQNRNAFINSFGDQDELDDLRTKVQEIARIANGEYMEEFFQDFAGQARIRWHYGAAHPILSDIENCYIAEKGRNWLANEEQARAKLVLGEVNDQGLIWFDIREFWQVGSAIIVVAGSCGGAFILSFFTPTVGLGCRSGGYTIFFMVALGLLIVEMTVWLVLSPYEVDLLGPTPTRLRNNPTFTHMEERVHDRWTHLKKRASSFLLETETWLTATVVWIVLLWPWKNKDIVKEKTAKLIKSIIRSFHDMSPQRRWDLFFFRPVEMFNTLWLIYIVLAQTFGVYRNCNCMTSTWGGGGGYLDFSVQDSSNSKWVLYYWVAGTVLTSLVMGLSMFYITVEWCQQSFLSTEHYSDAMKGLQMVRQYRHWTWIFRVVSRKLSKITLDPLEKLAEIIGLIKRRQKTLLWTRTHEWDPDVPGHRNSVSLPRHRVSPSIELQDYSSQPHDESAVHDTPAMAHSLFPPAIPRRRPRNESDNSPPPPLFHPRMSNESSVKPLVRRPVEANYVHERLSLSDDERRSSGEYLLSPMSPPADSSLSRPLLGFESSLQIRQGYRRASSDPGSPPDLSTVLPGALGIHVSHEDLERGV